MAKPNQKYLDTTTYLSAEFTSGEDVVPIVLVDPDTGEPYVPGGGGGTVTGAINGLSLDGTNVILGGSALDRATTIDGASQTFTLGTVASPLSTGNINTASGSGFVISDTQGIFEGTMSVNGFGSIITGENTSTGVSPSVFASGSLGESRITLLDGVGGEASFKANTTGLLLMNSVNNKGVKYNLASDYSSIVWATDDDYIPSIGLIKSNETNIYTQDGQITSNRSVLATASENFSLGFSATPSEVFNLLQLGGTNVSIYGLSAGLPTGFFQITPTITEVNSDVATGTTLISGNNITATATTTNQVIGSVVDLDASNNLTADAVNNVTVTAQNGDITLQNNTGSGGMNFNVGSGAMLVSGGGSFEGFKYVADIRANLVDKSLVPKDYVDARFDVSASSASYTPDADSNDGTTLTALATNLTINAPTGTPKEGQRYVIKIKDDGTSRTLTWNAIYQDNWAGGTINTLPTATTIGKWHRLEFEYNSTDTKWDVISIREEV